MKKKALLLMLVLVFISTNALSQNWIQGQITGDVQEGISVNLYQPYCGSDDLLVDTYTTNSEGYYGFGCLANGVYRVAPDNVSYNIDPEFVNVQIPQAVIQSYDFTSDITCENVDRFLDNNDGTLTDCMTGLILLKNTSCAGNMEWQDAMDAAAAIFSGQCGLTDGSEVGDWRLPTLIELQSIGTDPPSSYDEREPDVPEDWMDFTDPAVSPFENVGPYNHWTSNETGDPGDYYVIRVTDGMVRESDGDGTPQYVLPVRKEPSCDNVDRFLGNNDGTVTDCRTDFIWLKNANCLGLKGWHDAMTSATRLNSGECNLSDGSEEGDWHLATKEELQGLGTDPPAVWDSGGPSVEWGKPVKEFINVQSYLYWTSTLDVYYENFMTVDITSGLSNVRYKGDVYYVWPVRLDN